MSPDSMLYVFVTLRSVHIAVAALWLGSAALLVWFVMPSAGNLAPEMNTRLVRNKQHVFMGALGGTTGCPACCCTGISCASAPQGVHVRGVRLDEIEGALVLDVDHLDASRRGQERREDRRASRISR
jgi:hypothetical protein